MNLKLRYDDPLAKVEEAVETWARHQMKWKPQGWWPGRDGTCRDAVSSDQWEEPDDVLDARRERVVVAAVDGAMDSLEAPQRAVIWQTYANAVGPAVWKCGALSGRERSELVELHRGALTALRSLLRKRGVLT